MKRFWLAGVLGALLCALQISAIAAEKNVPKVTRDNFISLDYQRVGGIAALETQIAVKGNEIILEEIPRFRKLEGNTGLFSGQPLPFIQPRSQLSNNQLDALLAAANKSRLTALAGKYEQPNLVDGFTEMLVLTISDEKNQDKTFVIENYGDKAPAGFYQITAYLRQLRLDKFRGASEPVAALVTRENFQMLTFETSGGFANLHSPIDVRPVPNGKEYSLYSSQYIGTQSDSRSTSLTNNEFSELIVLLNSVNFPELDRKKFVQKNLFDGLNEVLTLELKDGRKFTVSNYGNQAPPEYYALTQHLNQLKSQKLNKPGPIQ